MPKLFSILSALLMILPLSAELVSYADKVVVLEIGEKALVNKQSFKFWQRTLARVNEEGAKAVIFELDTPGGLAFDTKDLMVNELRDLEVPSYAFIDDEAISAGAMISIACDEIWMTPGSTIGAAAIINGNGVEIEKVMRGKLESFFDANIRAVTKDKGHPTEIVQMMMFIDDERVRRYGPAKVQKGKLLTLTASEAVQQFKGKPLLAKGIAESREELFQKLGFTAEDVVVAEQTGFESLAWHVSAWSSLLILIGVGGIYFEMKSPGFGLGIAVAAAAFGVFFFGNFVAGNLAGYEVVAVFVLGVIFVILEIAIFPGMIMGIIGGCMMVGALLFSMVDRFDFKRLGEQDFFTGEKFSVVDVFFFPLLSLAIGLVGGLGLIFLMIKYLPNLPIPGFVLKRTIGAGGSVAQVDSAVEELEGQVGVATMDLRPAGKIAIGETIYDVITKGEFIEKGSSVRIVAKEQMRTIVEKA